MASEGDGYSFIRSAQVTMQGDDQDCAALLLATEGSLPAKHHLKDPADLSTVRHSLDDAASHDPYRPVVRLMRLMCDLTKEGLTASVPRVPGRSKVGTSCLACTPARPKVVHSCWH